MLSLSTSFWEIGFWCIAALWAVYLTLLITGLRRRQVLAATNKVLLPRGLPRISVLIAGRNEEECFEICLRSLLRQDYPNLEIIAINDRSTDTSGEILDRLEMEFADQLRVIHIDELPSGWFGKTHAMHVGTQSAGGDWLLYIDADCEIQSESAVSLAVQEAQRRGVDALSLTPQFVLNTAWEQMTVPVCSSIMMVWFQPARVNNPKLSTSYANGAFLMISRHCYDSLGGWCRFRAQMSEDIAIARAVKSNGWKLAVLQNAGLYQTCMYDSVRDSWNGWSRIFYGALPREALALSIARSIICSAVPAGTLLLWLGIACWNGAPADSWNGILAATSTAIILQQIYMALIFRAVGSNVFWSLTAPLGQLVTCGMLGRALMSHIGIATMQWSGAIVRRGQIVTLPRPEAASLPIHTTPAR
jgi:glycosyltransferase involved in cell wall biosynthesis